MVKRITVHGRKIWQARVFMKGVRKSRLCGSKDAARQVERDLG